MTRIVGDRNPVNEDRARRGEPPAPSAGMSIATAAAIAATGAFAGGGLLTQTVLVPYWQDIDPAVFLKDFGKYGPATGATLFPFEVASTVLLGIVLYSALRSRRRGRLAWGVAWSCMAGTVLLLPVYFADANDALIHGTISSDQVGAQLRSWYLWNWLRTGLAFLAVVFSCVGLGFQNRTGQ